MNRFIFPAGDFTFRPDSQDMHTIATVMYGNCYRLPDKAFGADDVVVDVGANIGCFAFMCLGRGAGAVHCYEPHPDNLRLLRQNLAPFDVAPFAPYARVFPLALWRRGEPVIDLEDCGKFTAMHTACLRGAGGKRVRVPATDLDMILAGHDRVRLLKLDCEGAEWPALYTAAGLGKVQELLVELHHSLTVAGFDCTGVSVAKHLESQGFDASLWPADDCNQMLRAVRKG